MMSRNEKGSGSLYQAKDKTWVYQYNEDGKRRARRFKKKAEARLFIESLNKANAILISRADSGPSPTKTAGVITVGDWFDRWLETYAKPSVKLSTYCSYELYIRAHIKPMIGEKYMNTITADELQEFFNDRGANGNLQREGGLSPKTLTNIRNMMHIAFDQALKNGMITVNFVESVRLPKAEKKEMRVLNREEQSRLIAAARLAPEPAAFGIIFDLFTGLRIGELCGLRWKNVNMDDHSIRVCETRNRLPNFDDSIETATSVKTVESTKTASSRRTVYMTDSLYKDFQQYMNIQLSLKKQYPSYNPDGYVFCQENGDPYEPRTYEDLFKRCVRQAGIRDANFHALRHTFATRSLEQGMDVVTLSKLLGHANPSVTMDKYGHAIDAHKRQSVQRLDDLYAAPPQPSSSQPAQKDSWMTMEW